MVRKLKTYVTSIGFFDLAVAAPSMKAAVESWGAASDIFQKGFAKETSDPEIVSRTQAYPGAVLRRPVGSDGEFKQTSDLPKTLNDPNSTTEQTIQVRPPVPKSAAVRDQKAERAATRAYERDEARRKKHREEAEVARDKERARRDKAISKGKLKLAKAQAVHETKMAEIARSLQKLESERDEESDRWHKQRRDLEAEVKKL